MRPPSYAGVSLNSSLFLTTRFDDIASILPVGSQPLLLAPSTMRADDRLVGLVREQLPSARALVPRRMTRYRRVSIDTPGAKLGAIRLPEAILAPGMLVCVADLDRLPPSGPFALDLLARFVSPLDRIRLLASRERSGLVAEVNLARRFDRVILATTLRGERMWLATDDMVTGELTALALSESQLPANRERVNPWEDEVVQRATDFALGARYPGDIRAHVAAGANDRVMNDLLAALQLRIGIDF